MPFATCFRVLVPDLPGFGDSDMPSEPHTAEMLADLVASGLDAVLPSSMELDLAGFSFGGIIAGLAAARLRGRVRNLVLLGPAGLGLGKSPDRRDDDAAGAHRFGGRVVGTCARHRSRIAGAMDESLGHSSATAGRR